MKTKEFASLGKRLMPHMLGYISKSSLIFAQPIGHIVRGLYFDSSSHNQKAFYIYVFFQPLCVPRNHFVFNFGFRIKTPAGIDGWFSDDQNLIGDLISSIQNKAIPFLDQVETLNGATAFATAAALDSSNPNVSEAAAFCRALSGDRAGALSSLNAIKLSADRQVPWQAAIADRAEFVSGLLENDPPAARKQLLQWEGQTAQNVGLGAFWSRDEKTPG